MALITVAFTSNERRTALSQSNQCCRLMLNAECIFSWVRAHYEACQARPKQQCAAFSILVVLSPSSNHVLCGCGTLSAAGRAGATFALNYSGDILLCQRNQGSGDCCFKSRPEFARARTTMVMMTRIILHRRNASRSSQMARGESRWFACLCILAGHRSMHF